MKTNKIVRPILSLLLAMVAICSMLLPASAKSNGFTLFYDDTYEDSCAVIGYQGAVPETLVIPSTHNGKEVYGVLAGTFRGCKTLKKVTFESDYVSVERAAFADCANLTTVKGHELSCESYAFNKCRQLSTLDAKIAFADEYSFAECKSLKTITISSYCIFDHSFEGCKNLKKVNVACYDEETWFDDDSYSHNKEFFDAEWDYIYFHKDFITKSKQVTMFTACRKRINVLDYFDADELAGDFAGLECVTISDTWCASEEHDGGVLKLFAEWAGRETKLVYLVDADGNVIGALRLDINVIPTVKDLASRVNYAAYRVMDWIF